MPSSTSKQTSPTQTAPKTTKAVSDRLVKSQYVDAGMIPRMTIPPSLTDMPKDKDQAAERLTFSEPVLTPEGITRGINLDPTTAKALQGYVTSLLGSSNELQFKSAIMRHLMHDHRQLDPMQRQAIAQRAASFYKTQGKSPDTQIAQTRAEGFTMKKAPMCKAAGCGGMYKAGVCAKCSEPMAKAESTGISSDFGGNPDSTDVRAVIMVGTQEGDAEDDSSEEDVMGLDLDGPPIGEELDMEPSIVKSEGEGSRGGRVLGHTASGKPIYESIGKTASGKDISSGKEFARKVPGGTDFTTHDPERKAQFAGAHEGWSSQDHKDAARAHDLAGDSAKGNAAKDRHHAMMSAHTRATEASKPKQSQSEFSTAMAARAKEHTERADKATSAANANTGGSLTGSPHDAAKRVAAGHLAAFTADKQAASTHRQASKNAPTLKEGAEHEAAAHFHEKRAASHDSKRKEAEGRDAKHNSPLNMAARAAFAASNKARDASEGTSASNEAVGDAHRAAVTAHHSASLEALKTGDTKAAAYHFGEATKHSEKAAASNYPAAGEVQKSSTSDAGLHGWLSKAFGDEDDSSEGEPEEEGQDEDELGDDEEEDEDLEKAKYTKRTAEAMEANEDKPMKKSEGEGSRGGKVIGHTSGGKPIYEADHTNILGTAKAHAALAKRNPSKVAQRAHEATLEASGYASKELHRTAAEAHAKAAGQAPNDARKRMHERLSKTHSDIVTAIDQQRNGGAASKKAHDATGVASDAGTKAAHEAAAAAHQHAIDSQPGLNSVKRELHQNLVRMHTNEASRMKKSQDTSLHGWLLRKGELAEGEPSMEPGSDTNGPMLDMDGMGANSGEPSSGPVKGSESMDTGKNEQLSEDDPEQAGDIDAELGLVEQGIDLSGAAAIGAGPTDAAKLGSKDKGPGGQGGGANEIGSDRIFKGRILQPSAAEVTHANRVNAQRANAAVTKDVTVGLGKAPMQKSAAPQEQASTWQKGGATYSNASDLAVEKAMQGDGFYQNGSPTLGTQGTLLKSRACQACHSAAPAWASRCPTCGAQEGEALAKSTVSNQPSIRAQGIRPAVRHDVHLPGGVKKQG